MSNKDKRADDIVEETMKSIYEDLDNLDKEEEHSELGEEFERELEEESEEFEEEQEFEEPEEETEA